MGQRANYEHCLCPSMLLSEMYVIHFFITGKTSMNIRQHRLDLLGTTSQANAGGNPSNLATQTRTMSYLSNHLVLPREPVARQEERKIVNRTRRRRHTMTWPLDLIHLRSSILVAVMRVTRNKPDSQVRSREFQKLGEICQRNISLKRLPMTMMNP